MDLANGLDDSRRVEDDSLNSKDKLSYKCCRLARESSLFYAFLLQSLLNLSMAISFAFFFPNQVIVLQLKLGVIFLTQMAASMVLHFMLSKAQESAKDALGIKSKAWLRINRWLSLISMILMVSLTYSIERDIRNEFGNDKMANTEGEDAKRQERLLKYDQYMLR